MKLYAFEHQEYKYQILQIVYLRYACHKTPSEITPYVDYAYNTVKTYMYKFRDEFEESEKIFSARKEFDWSTQGIMNSVFFEPENEKCYFMKFYDTEGNLVFSKIGTTKGTVQNRAEKLKSSYRVKISKVEILKAFQAGGIPAEGMESYVRSMLMIDYPEYFIKNDRYCTDIPAEEFEKYCQEYLNLIKKRLDK